MPNRSRKSNTLPVVLLALSGTIALLVLSLTATVAAQDVTPTVQPTSEFDFSIQPTFEAFSATATIDPQMLPSLTGVGARPLNSNVSIRSGPGRQYQRIGFLAVDNWIDIVGWNGWDEGRACSPQFENDLDMWVQVPHGSGYGWIARCVLDVRGILTDLPVVSASGERTLQR